MSNVSAAHCRVRRLDAPLPPSAVQNASSKQSELNSTNETIKFSVTLARQRVVGVADPYRIGAYNAIMPITPRTRRKHSSHFLKFSAVHCRVRRAAAVGGTERKLQTKRIKQHEYSKRTLCPQFRTSNRRLIISIKHFLCKLLKCYLKNKSFLIYI